MPQRFEAGRVCAARLLSPRIRNITIAAESLVGFAFEPGVDMAIRLPGGDGGTDERHYSVWKSTAEGKFDLCVVLHGLGPGKPMGRGGARRVTRSRSRAPTLSRSQSTAR
jgi:ferredoxin-NADP reductase